MKQFKEQTESEQLQNSKNPPCTSIIAHCKIVLKAVTHNHGRAGTLLRRLLKIEIIHNLKRFCEHI